MKGHVAGPARADVLVAGGCAILTMATLLLLPVLAQADPAAAADGAPSVASVAWWAALATLVVQSAVLAWRRRRPEWAAAAVAVPMGAAVGMGPALGLTSVALLVTVYALASHRSPSRSWPLLTAIGFLVAGGHVAGQLSYDVPLGEAAATALLRAIGVIGAPLVVAALVVARRESRSAREDRLLALEREQDALVEVAVARERTAMARELHDIAAHHLTGIAVMSAAIATQIDTDPAAGSHPWAASWLGDESGSVNHRQPARFGAMLAP